VRRSGGGTGGEGGEAEFQVSSFMKGVMIQNSALCVDVKILDSKRSVSFCHAPLSQSARINLLSVIANGSRVGIFGRIFGDGFFEDCRMLGPASVSLVPRYYFFSESFFVLGVDIYVCRIWEIIYEKFRASFEKRCAKFRRRPIEEIEVAKFSFFSNLEKITSAKTFSSSFH
jgi:hypothetical protein